MKAAQRTLERVVVATVELDTLPPMSLSKNSRRHWLVKHRDFQYVKTLAWAQLHEQRGPRVYPALGMRIEWYQAGAMTDDDNIIARCAAIRDAAEAVGLVVSDADIVVIGVERTRVHHKCDQRVVVQFVEDTTTRTEASMSAARIGDLS